MSAVLLHVPCINACVSARDGKRLAFSYRRLVTYRQRKDTLFDKLHNGLSAAVCQNTLVAWLPHHFKVALLCLEHSKPSAVTEIEAFTHAWESSPFQPELRFITLRLP